MKSEIINLLLAVLSGGAGATILQAILNRKKNKVDITGQSIQTALDLESLSKKRYLEEVEKNREMREKLRKAEELLSDVKMELEKKNLYILQLHDILLRNNIEIPEAQVNANRDIPE